MLSPKLQFKYQDTLPEVLLHISRNLFRLFVQRLLLLLPFNLNVPVFAYHCIGPQSLRHPDWIEDILTLDEDPVNAFEVQSLRLWEEPVDSCTQPLAAYSAEYEKRSNALGSMRSQFIAAYMMKYLNPSELNPVGVASTTVKVNSHVEVVENAVIGVRTLRGAISDE
jgi:hypothetical protein